MEKNPLQRLADLGQSPWLDNIRRGMITSGDMQRLIDEGIVGVTLDEQSHGWDSHIIEFFALGTAVVPTGGPAEIAAPSPVLSLND